MSGLVDLCDLNFDNSFVRELPADPVLTTCRAQVRNACYTRVEPTPVPAPQLLAWSDEVGELLGIARPDSPAGPVAEVLAGNRVLPGMQPYAARYGGHQFGHWAGQLGDGRAITLGEVVGPDGVRQELQLKGAGRTPYSRTADGRAVLRSSVREFLCSEAMHHLGVPTTRALSLVATGEAVMRDMFYDGHPQPSRARSSAASRRRSCASATSRSSPRAGAGRAQAPGRLRDRRAFSRSWARRRPRLMRAGSKRSAAAPPR